MEAGRSPSGSAGHVIPSELAHLPCVTPAGGRAVVRIGLWLTPLGLPAPRLALLRFAARLRLTWLRLAPRLLAAAATLDRLRLAEVVGLGVRLVGVVARRRLDPVAAVLVDVTATTTAAADRPERRVDRAAARGVVTADHGRVGIGGLVGRVLAVVGLIGGLRRTAAVLALLHTAARAALDPLRLAKTVRLGVRLVGVVLGRRVDPVAAVLIDVTAMTLRPAGIAGTSDRRRARDATAEGGVVATEHEGVGVGPLIGLVLPLVGLVGGLRRSATFLAVLATAARAALDPLRLAKTVRLGVRLIGVVARRRLDPVAAVLVDVATTTAAADGERVVHCYAATRGVVTADDRR